MDLSLHHSDSVLLLLRIHYSLPRLLTKNYLNLITEFAFLRKMYDSWAVKLLPHNLAKFEKPSP